MTGAWDLLHRSGVDAGEHDHPRDHEHGQPGTERAQPGAVEVRRWWALFTIATSAGCAASDRTPAVAGAADQPHDPAVGRRTAREPSIRASVAWLPGEVPRRCWGCGSRRRCRRHRHRGRAPSRSSTARRRGRARSSGSLGRGRAVQSRRWSATRHLECGGASRSIQAVQRPRPACVPDAGGGSSSPATGPGAVSAAPYQP